MEPGYIQELRGERGTSGKQAEGDGDQERIERAGVERGF